MSTLKHEYKHKDDDGNEYVVTLVIDTDKLSQDFINQAIVRKIGIDFGTVFRPLSDTEKANLDGRKLENVVKFITDHKPKGQVEQLKEEKRQADKELTEMRKMLKDAGISDAEIDKRLNK